MDSVLLLCNFQSWNYSPQVLYYQKQWIITRHFKRTVL